MDEPRHSLDDPDYAAFAWGRYRRILRWMALVGVAAAIAAVLVLRIWLGWLNVHVAIATALGVFATVMLGAALMGLMFLSSGTHRDEEVFDPLKDEIDID